MEDNGLSNLFKKGMGDCPPMPVLDLYARGKTVSEEEARHFKICPMCRRAVRSLKEGKDSFVQDEVSETSFDFEELLSRNVESLSRVEVDFVFNKIIDQGFSVSAFGISDIEKLDSIETKREIIQRFKETRDK